MTARLIPTTKRLFLSLMLVTTVHGQWEPLPTLPEPNGGFVCGVTEGRIEVIGGTNWAGGKKNWLNKRHVFDPAKMTWSTDPMSAVTVAYGVTFQSGSGFSFLGGFDGEKGRDFTPGVLAAGGQVGEFRIVVGGTDDPANIAGVSRETWKVGRGGHEQRLADYPDRAFGVAACAVAGDELFLFGGMNYDEGSKGAANTDVAYAFSPMKNLWRKLTPLAAPTRGLSAVKLDDNHIYIAGGYTDDFTADAVIYDVKANSYRKACSLPYAAMVGLVKMGEHVYCLGGEDKQQSRTDRFFRIPVTALLK